MKSKIFTLFLLTTILLSVGMISAEFTADYIETFDNSLATSTYADSLFDGDNEITWNYVKSRDEGTSAINGNGLTLGDLSDGAKIYSDTIANGIGSFSVKLNPAAISVIGNRQVELYIDDELKGTSAEFSEDSEVITFEVLDLNIEGDIKIEIRNLKDKKVVIDDISWTEYTQETEDSFCSIPDMEGDLRIKKVKIINRGPSNDGEDEKWFPLDRITVQVELENNGELEIEDMVFVLGLFEEDSSSDIAEDMFWISEDDEEIEIGDIEEKGEDDELEHTFEFRVNPEDLEKGKYLLKIKVYSDDLGEDYSCIDYSEDLTDFGTSEFYAEIDIDKEEEDEGRAVVVDTKKLPPIVEAGCNEEVLLDLDVWNIGDADQERVKVTLYNSELDLDMDYTIREGLDMGDDKENVDFNFIIPRNAEEKTYTLELRTLYDYDEDDDLYDEQSDVFMVFLKVEGNCRPEVSDALIIAELDPETPEAIAGKQVIIRTTITNPGETEATYSISIEGNSAWSSLGAIDPQTITLNPGTSQDVSIYLNLDAQAEGEKEFTIKATSIEGSVKEQKIALAIKKGMSQDKIIDHIKNNWFIYAIVIINLILIIAIISVVKRIAGKPIAM